MLNFRSYFAKQEKKEVCKQLNLLPLDLYIQKKCGHKIFDIKNFSTPLALGKYKLASLLRSKLSKATDFKNQRRIIFLAFKINEFLEQPGVYANLENPIKSELTNRSDFYLMMNGSEVFGIETSADNEMARLYELFKKMYADLDLTHDLPDMLATGSGWSWSGSSLHLVIKNLYEECKNITQSEQCSA